jgi:hypothetical protein
MPFAQHRRLHTFFMMNVFACMGLSTEVVFTALMSVINQEPHCGKPLIALAGYTYVWMVFIYASIPLLGYFFFDKIKHRPLFVRLLTYTVFVYVIEFFFRFIIANTHRKLPLGIHHRLSYFGISSFRLLPGMDVLYFSCREVVCIYE